jgi:hypothetical protein
MAVIAFIGDSYCATYASTKTLHQQQSDLPTYTTIISDHYRHAVARFGFSGKSWWYSWAKFCEYWQDKLDQIEYIIFTHTDSDRINNSTHDEVPHLHESFSATSKMREVGKNYFKYLHDADFNKWSQQQYFKLLKEKFDKIKTVHLHCYSATIPYSHLLPGVVFTTPLATITVGEIRGSKKTIITAMRDNRANHLNSHNNQALAKAIIQALDNYTPGQYALPLELFDQPNNNAMNWPDGKYWTEE